jgi:hypothetical protein
MRGRKWGRTSPAGRLAEFQWPAARSASAWSPFPAVGLQFAVGLARARMRCTAAITSAGCARKALPRSVVQWMSWLSFASTSGMATRAWTLASQFLLPRGVGQLLARGDCRWPAATAALPPVPPGRCWRPIPGRAAGRDRARSALPGYPVAAAPKSATGLRRGWRHGPCANATVPIPAISKTQLIDKTCPNPNLFEWRSILPPPPCLPPL